MKQNNRVHDSNGHKRILIVDDEKSILLVTKQWFNKLGEKYEIDVAGSGEEALEKFTAHPFDLVITDLKMPGMDGIELTEQIWAAFPRTHVLMMSAFCTPAQLDRMHERGIHNCIAKPFSSKNLVNLAQNLLSKKGDEERDMSSSLVKHEYET